MYIPLHRPRDNTPLERFTNGAKGLTKMAVNVGFTGLASRLAKHSYNQSMYYGDKALRRGQEAYANFRKNAITPVSKGNLRGSRKRTKSYKGHSNKFRNSKRKSTWKRNN